MANSTDTQWSPPHGRHQVNIGASLSRTLKARKGLQAKPSRNMPVSDFYLVKYSFKPESLDATKPGTVEVTQGADMTSVRVEQASYQSDEVHIFKGKEDVAKEVECVLIYNEEDGVFTLEKIDSTLHLGYDKKGPAKSRLPSASPMPTPSGPSPEASTSRIEQDTVSALDKHLLSTLEEVDGSDALMPPPPPPTASTSTAKSKGRKSEPAKKSAAAATTKEKPKPKSRTTNKAAGASAIKANSVQMPISPIPSSRFSAPTRPPAASSGTMSGSSTTMNTNSNNSTIADGDVEEFDFSLGLASDPDHAPEKSKGFALPTGSSSNTFVTLAPPVSASVPDEDDGWGNAEMAEWENALNPSTTVEEYGEEIDISALEEEMHLELGGADADADVDVGMFGGGSDDDDMFGDGDADSSGEDSAVEVEGHHLQQPQPLSQFAAGMNYGDDETDSSSDSSEDD